MSADNWARCPKCQDKHDKEWALKVKKVESTVKKEGKMKHTETCYHPELIPTAWDQKRPEPYTGETCACGKNFCCPVCGYGHGCYPCDCSKPKETDALHS